MIGLLALASAGLASAQPKPLTPDLTAAPSEHGWKLINRSARLIERNGAPAIHLEGETGAGFLRLENVVFADGTIEFDARGRNVVQGSFLGLAFHGGADVKTYDAVYFRPFNFKASDPARRARAVQYISLPAHPWQKLRAEHPGQYEKAVVPVPDPDAWFHVRLVVAWPQVSVFVDGGVEPCLVVTQLSERKRGWLALWTDVSGGDFANLKILPASPTPP
ncbi:hypothetical protein DB354_04460 [Opitutus sp. ER46]|nr:hypothetical protein DB354_04460 [Opitutus sp. ER46]